MVFSLGAFSLEVFSLGVFSLEVFSLPCNEEVEVGPFSLKLFEPTVIANS